MKTAEDYANEIVEQVHNGASVSDVMQLLEEYASQFKTVEPEKEEFCGSDSCPVDGGCENCKFPVDKDGNKLF